MAVNKVVMNTENGAQTLIDLTGDSVTPEALDEGVTAHDASGNQIVGTAPRLIDYAPRCKTYEITLAKSSKWVLLATLDAEVLAHINDASLVVSFVSINNPYEYVSYSLNMAVCSNTQIGVHNNYQVYGVSGRTVNATSINQQWSYYPANKTDTDRSIGGFAFRVSDGKYYIYPVDGYVREGTYLLTFAWKE